MEPEVRTELGDQLAAAVPRDAGPPPGDEG
jgi:hypothetical protein